MEEVFEVEDCKDEDLAGESDEGAAGESEEESGERKG